jgi:membrane associated rhomboid family serine protease
MYRFSGGRFGGTPPVTKNLIIINVVLLLGTMVLQQTGLNLNRFLGMYYFQSPLFAPWQIVTHMFMHGGIAHIFFNMYALWIFGKTLESVWGSKRFLIYYLATGLGCGIFPSAGKLHRVCPSDCSIKSRLFGGRHQQFPA